MKTRTLFFLLAVCGMARAQSTRYFEFRTTCGHGNWQDSAFIAAATDPVRVAEVLNELNQPLPQRRFIGGPITYGNGGHNHNASHWFLWHFIPDQWNLADVATEVCDGCPYTDVDADTAYWIGNLGQFCPWSGQPVREVTLSAGITKPNPLDAIALFPNPGQNQVHLNLYGQMLSQATVYNALGKPVMRVPGASASALDVSTLAPGMYVLRLENGPQQTVKKFWVLR